MSTRLTRGATSSTASAARLMTGITSSHSPSTVVNIDVVSQGRPEARTTRTASATASLIEPSSLAVTVGAIAAEAGIPDAGAGPIDARHLPEDPTELEAAVEGSNVFGRVTPAQKRAMVGALHTMTGRRVSAFDPAVLTIAHLTAGTTTNVIPESAVLEGTVRTLSEQTRETMLTELRRVCTGVADAYGCTATVSIDRGYPVTVNDAGVADRVADVGRSVLGSRFVEPMPDPIMGAEDFSYVLDRVPGALAFLGACPPGTDPGEAPPNHSSRVVFDEEAMVSGVALYSGFVLDALRRG